MISATNCGTDFLVGLFGQLMDLIGWKAGPTCHAVDPKDTLARSGADSVGPHLLLAEVLHALDRRIARPEPSHHVPDVQRIDDPIAVDVVLAQVVLTRIQT